MTRVVSVFLGLVLVSGCGEGRKDVSASSDRVTEAFHQISHVKGTGEGSSYSGAFTFTIADAKSDCSTPDDRDRAKEILAEAKKSTLPMACRQGDGSYQCAVGAGGVPLRGYIHKDGAFRIGAKDQDSEGSGRAEAWLNGTAVLDGRFTGGSDTGSGTLQVGLTKSRGSERIDCFFEFQISFTRGGKAGKAPSAGGAGLELEFERNGSAGSRSYRNLRVRETESGLAFRARGSRGEEIAGRFDDRDASVRVTLKGSDGRPIESGALRNCSHDDRDGKIEFECEGLRGTLDLPR